MALLAACVFFLQKHGMQHVHTMGVYHDNQDFSVPLCMAVTARVHSYM